MERPVNARETEKPLLLDKFKYKILLTLFSLVLTLTAAEAGLRVFTWAFRGDSLGELYPEDDASFFSVESRRHQQFEVYPGSAWGRTNIIAIGDSFTNAGNSFWKDSYPYALYELFEKKIPVRNLGYCEDSTPGTLSRLKAYVNSDQFDPSKKNILVVLVGAADYFSDDRGAVAQSWYKPEEFHNSSIWYRQLKLFKVYRYVVQEVYFRWKSHRLSFSQRKIAGEAKNCITEATIEERVDCFRGFAQKIDGDSPKLRSLSRTVGSFVFHKDYERQYAKQMHSWMEILPHFPEILEDATVRFRLVQSFIKQSQVSSTEFFELLTKLADNGVFLRLKSVHAFIDHIKKWVDNDQWLESRNRKLWEELIQFCEEKGIQIVLQNYPTQYPAANALLEEVAKKHQIPLVDNKKIFAELVAKYSYEKYFADDDHCTPEGYRVMAQNVMAILQPLVTDRIQTSSSSSQE